MAVQEVRICDVFKTSKKVGRYRLILLDLDKELEVADDLPALGDIRIDLSQRALDRLQRLIQRGTTPPVTAKNT